MGLMLSLEAISLYGEYCTSTYICITFNPIADHYFHLTTFYWVVFTLLLIATILVIAVSKVILKAWIQTISTAGANLHLGSSAL